MLDVAAFCMTHKNNTADFLFKSFLPTGIKTLITIKLKEDLHMAS